MHSRPTDPQAWLHVSCAACRRRRFRRRAIRRRRRRRRRPAARRHRQVRPHNVLRKPGGAELHVAAGRARQHQAPALLRCGSGGQGSERQSGSAATAGTAAPAQRPPRARAYAQHPTQVLRRHPAHLQLAQADPVLLVQRRLLHGLHAGTVEPAKVGGLGGHHWGREGWGGQEGGWVGGWGGQDVERRALWGARSGMRVPRPSPASDARPPARRASLPQPPPPTPAPSAHPSPMSSWSNCTSTRRCREARLSR